MAEHVDDTRPSYLQILRDMDIDDPADASDDQLVDAGVRRALDGLVSYKVMEAVPRREAVCKKISARWDHVYKWDSENKAWVVKSRYVAREYKWQELRSDLFTPGSTTGESRLVDYIALKHGWPTFTVDAEDAYYHAPEDEGA